MKVIKRITVATLQVRELLVLVDDDMSNTQIEEKLEKTIRSEACDWFEMNAPPVTATVNPEIISLEEVPKRYDVWEFTAGYEQASGLCEVNSSVLRAYLETNEMEKKNTP